MSSSKPNELHLPADSEALLVELLADSQLESESRVAERLRAEPDLGRRLVDLRATERLLRDIGLPPELSEDELDPERDVLQVCRALAESGKLTRRSPYLRRLLAVAAALIAVVTAAQRWGSEPSPDTGQRVVLSEAASPLGSVADFAAFRIPIELLSGERVRIRIHADEADLDPDHIVLESPELSGSTWNLTDTEREALRGVERIRWTFRTLGGVERHGEYFAWRSSSR